jgi:hypothetical protein
VRGQEESPVRLVTIVVSVAVAAWPAHAGAQTPAPSGVLSANDLSVAVVGSSERETAQAPFGHWLASSGWSVAASHAWTDHWRTELTFGRLNPVTGYAELTTPVSPMATTYRDDAWTVRRTTLALTAVYQFGHNAWVHPYVAGGVTVSEEAWSGREDRQTYTSTPQNFNVRLADVSAVLPASTHTVVRPVAVLGLKVYLARRVYARAEVHLLGASTADLVVLRAGVGFDF